jgi:Gram-negative porin
MKKLMLTTAIASVLTTAAIAQTTITGELRISYKDVSAPKGLTASNSGTPDTSYGFGAEQQINIQTKGKLNVGGLEYAAGFAIENDGEQTGTLFNENVYIDLTNASSGTTISFGRDHIQRSDTDFSATNLVAFTPNELSQTTNATAGGTRFKQNIGPAASQAYGAAIVQKTPVGTFSYNYVPNNANPAATADVTNGTTPTSANVVGVASSEAVNPNTTAAYEYGFVGDLTVKGLQVHYFKSANQDFAQTWNTGAVKAEAKNYGVKYNFGEFTLGANKKVYNSEAATLTETTETAFAAAYAVNKDLTIGVIKAKAENTGSAIDHTVKGINLGYALGPVNLAVGYARNTDALGVAGADNDVFMARLIGAF